MYVYHFRKKKLQTNFGFSLSFLMKYMISWIDIVQLYIKLLYVYVYYFRNCKPRDYFAYFANQETFHLRDFLKVDFNKNSIGCKNKVDND